MIRRNITLPPEMNKQLETFAKQTGVSVSELLRRFIVDGIEDLQLKAAREKYLKTANKTDIENML